MAASGIYPSSNATTDSFSTHHTFSSSSSALPYSAHHEEPTFKIVIVGAGVGGLMLGHCLERAGIDYVILERHQKQHFTQNIIQLTSKTLHALEQLGLLDEIMRISKPMSFINLRKQNMSFIGRLDFRYTKERYGYYAHTVKRTEFCKILASRMRQDRIEWGRYVLEIVNGNAGVQCRCTNGYVVQGDIIVGADGAYSAVRQNLYRALKMKGNLPKTDMEDLKFTQNAITGITNPVDLTQYPDVGNEFGEANIVIGKESPHTLWISAVSENRISWTVTGPLLTSNGSIENVMVSEFGPEEAENACRLIKDLKVPFGGTVADLIANTPKDCLLKYLVLEKFPSFAGQGAEQAILDAICLVNLLTKIQAPYLLRDIDAAFKSYHEQRLPIIETARYKGQVAALVNSQGWSAEMKRKIVFNLPVWVQAHSTDKTLVNPLLDFLPPIQSRGLKSARSFSSSQSVHSAQSV
ncbi:hypothetical protein BGZ51_008159 [Haplosporangium sp. Z 767]|nr:hypothetical protein BGZ50_007289 [Haplosporangium sp. Z 11]KAF9190874.1 hypothetical protein BGZ51_008159 [Haplosporangium sp. Z 767]